MQVPIHRVLVERNEHVDLVTHVADRPVAGANCEESMAAAYDRLVSVVGVEMQPTPRKDKRQNVPGGGDPLAVLTPNTDCDINRRHYAGTAFCFPGVKFGVPETNKEGEASLRKRSLSGSTVNPTNSCLPSRNSRDPSTSLGMTN